ncbi:GreA/GreB family elongation factor [Zunongwangia sp.]|uniref:GreA/GreB family elongation factor n=1 Tax=Zunongwangia sp. TaxID=1965325 RepID=UPI003AA954BD
MSRGFVKEEDQEEAPVIPPRAALPAGVINYVTPEGYKALEDEQKELELARKNVDTENETEKRRAKAIIDGKLKLLAERRTAARIIYPNQQPSGEVRFGAFVNLLNKNTNTLQAFKIVGVDEANVKQQKIAFVAPIAKAVTGKKVGEIVEFQLGQELRLLEIQKITYASE